MEENYLAAANRYNGSLQFRRCGKSGVKLPEISLGFWKNFGSVNDFPTCRDIVRCAFDNGITHFDLANNYGPLYGTAEQTFGKLMDLDFRPYRDELFIATKAGYDMWPGPYGNWGSRKYLMASLDQSLRRMHLDYVDVFYIHRFDPETPLEETLQALVDVVRQGKALYVGISRWPKKALTYGLHYLAMHDVPCLLYQGKLNLLDRAPQEEGIMDELIRSNVGFIGFSPLAQGLLTDRYLNGIPEGSRMSRAEHLQPEVLTSTLLSQLLSLNRLAVERGEKLVQLSLKWVLQQKGVTSVIVGASSKAQLQDSLKATQGTPLSDEEIQQIEEIPNRNSL